MEGPQKDKTGWNLGVEIIYKDDCIKERCRSFLCYSPDHTQEAVLCYASDGHPKTHKAIHEHNHRAYSPKYKVNLGDGSSGGKLLRYWTIKSSGGMAAQGVFVRSTLARSLDADPAKASQMAGAFHYDNCYGNANNAIDVLKELEKGSDLSNVVCNDYEAARKSLTSTNFVLFSFLPAEIRIKIWGLASHHARFIQIVHQPTPDTPSSKYLHKFYAVSPLSCLPPPILHANSESRYEGSKYYEQTELEFLSPTLTEKRIYVNPSVDILLFSARCCVGTLMQFCRVAFLRRQKFRRVAVSSSRKFADCCAIHFNWPDRGTQFSGCDMDSEPIDVIRGLNTSGSEIYWGPSRNVSNGRNSPSSMEFFPGISGIEEILHVTDTFLDKVKPQGVDYTTTFRAADTKAIIDLSERGFSQIIEHWVDEYRQGLPAKWETKDTNAWVKGTLPKFSFVNLTPIKPSENGNTSKDSETWNSLDLEHSNILREDVRTIIESVTGCRLNFPARMLKRDHIYQRDRLEIGIAGPTDTAVQEALAVIHELAKTTGPWQSSFHRFIRRTGRYFPPSRVDYATLGSLQVEPRRTVPNEQFRTAINASMPKSPLMSQLEDMHEFMVSTGRLPNTVLGFQTDADQLVKHKWWLKHEYRLSSRRLMSPSVSIDAFRSTSNCLERHTDWSLRFVLLAKCGLLHVLRKEIQDSRSAIVWLIILWRTFEAPG
ncbi:hypothetical protein VTL71DRAFT_7583 [Oculimacula yallundae]|uniref:2EXR domain-containing protein n=1 Tax=Oculimacula yallundae TaxID=86028 RepID=A0ABR4BUJ7_9HELO